MAKKKMCPKWIKPYMLGGLNLSGVCVNKALDPSRCHKNVNEKCEIVQPRKKDKVIKAWAFRYRDREGLLKLYANEHKSSMPVKNLPCTITIKADAWDKIKGDK